MSVFTSHAAAMPSHLQGRFFDLAGRTLAQAAQDYLHTVTVAMNEAAVKATLHNDSLAAEEARTLNRVRNDVLTLINTALVNSAQALATEQNARHAQVAHAPTQRPQDPGVA